MCTQSTFCQISNDKIPVPPIYYNENNRQELVNGEKEEQELVNGENEKQNIK